MSIINSADEFFSGTATCPYEDVELPDGRTMRIRGLTAAERDELEMAVAQRRQKRQKAVKNGKQPPADIPFRGALVARTAIREDSSLIFKPTDAGRVAAMPAQIVSPLADAAIRLSGMRAEDVEELEGNSDETDEDGSSFGSPSLSEVEPWENSRPSLPSEN